MSIGRYKMLAGTPGTNPPAGYVDFYAKSDEELYFLLPDGTEVKVHPVGAGTGDLLSDGSVPLVANWDVGSFKIIAEQFESDVATGTAPLIVASTTLVANLNADLLDGLEASAFATAAQGGSADTALQPGDIDTLAELNALLTDATLGDQGDFATAAQGALADTAVQPGDIDTLAELNAIITDATLGDAGDFATAAHAHEGTAILSGGPVTDGHVLTADGAGGAAWEAPAAGGGDVATDSIWDAAGDLAVGSGADTAARLAIGTALQMLRVNAGGTALEWAAAPGGFASVNVQSGTSYTIQASDAGKVIVFTNAAAIAVTLPDDLDDFFQFTVVQAGAGVPTVTRSGTDTINGAATGVAPSAQWKGAYFTQYASGSWLALL